VRITCSHRGQDVAFETDATDVVIGRSDRHGPAAIDLTPDQRVSRRHARILVEEGRYWIEDLGSAYGTVVCGEEIKGRGKRRLFAGDVIRLGDTTLRVQIAAGGDDRDPAVPPQASAIDAVPQVSAAAVGAKRAHDGGDITETLDADGPIYSPTDTTAGDSARRLALLCDLPLRFGAEAGLDGLLETIVDRLVEAIPGAKRSALLVKERATGQLLLKAWAPGGGEPAVSLTSAQQAIDERQAFVWRRGQELTASQSEHDIASGMYAPLLWKGQALGVVCVDDCEKPDSFTGEDLRLMAAVAQLAAMAVANHYAQDDLRRHAEFTNRLFASRFPLRAREKLMREASDGTLVVGTRSSPITVLISDIRGFTKLTARLGARGTGDLLNEVFPRLVEVILAHDGTIERFAGDAIVSVFGSPEDDARQHEKAVRAALAMQTAMGEVNAARAARRKETCGIGIGIDCGEVLHGFLGDAERIEFAVIGDAANRASRYCDGAGAGEVLVSPEVHQRVFMLVQSTATSVQTKHEGKLRAFRVEGVRK
jgi:adenylate cyclase